MMANPSSQSLSSLPLPENGNPSVDFHSSFSLPENVNAPGDYPSSNPLPGNGDSPSEPHLSDTGTTSNEQRVTGPLGR